MDGCRNSHCMSNGKNKQSTSVVMAVEKLVALQWSQH